MNMVICDAWSTERERERGSNMLDLGEQQDLVESLINVVNVIGLIGDYRKNHRRNCLNLVRRIKFLGPLFEEVKDLQKPLPQVALECFCSLQKTFHSAKTLLQLCHDGSKLYLALESEALSGKFHALTEELEGILNDLPYDLLEISDEVREQVALMHLQLKRAKGRVDTQDVELCMNIMIAVSQKDDRNADIAILESLADKLQLRTISEMNMEARAVEKLLEEKSSKMGEITEQILHLLKKLRGMLDIEIFDESRIGSESSVLSRTPSVLTSGSPSIPEDFLCPISLDLMKDPVIVSTGQTYERASIQKWLDSGHRTCPKTQQDLTQLTVTPNYSLRSLIAQWCESNGVQLPENTVPTRRAGLSRSSDFLLRDRTHIDVLVQNLSCQQADVQRASAEEIRLLAKRNSDNRISISEAGAVPLLVKLLSSRDLITQEHAVTALLNLSIHETNKDLIVQSGAILPVIEVLKHGSMEARENSAATLFSLSKIDEHKVTIGDSGAIPALVDLLRDGTVRGKKDAATALFNLCMYQGNKGKAVEAGVVSALVYLVVDTNVGMVDEALAILSVLATHPEGRVAIGIQSTIHVLVKLIGVGSARNKENAAAVLLVLSKHDSSHLLTGLQLGVYEPLTKLAQSGNTRAIRKAKALLELMSKYEQVP